MRNVFDQYSQPENRVTHALMTALDQDRRLLNSFLHDLVKVVPPIAANKLRMLEQQYPWSQEPPEKEFERRGIPDGWIYNSDEKWCVFVESKVLTHLHAGQIERHRRTAYQRGFRKVIAVAIVPQLDVRVPKNTTLLEWRDVYDWLSRHRAKSMWAARALEFLEIAEARLIETQRFWEGTLTKFAGFPFDRGHPFTYLEGKRVLALALDGLRKRDDLRKRLGMNPTVMGRSKITGRQSEAVWNFLSLSHAADAGNFRRYPHLTLGINAQQVDVMVTIPNAISGRMKHNLKHLGDDGFQDLAAAIFRNMRPVLRRHPGAAPWFRGLQQRYPTQMSVPFVDAMIDFDLRTAIPSSGPPKTQPNWLSAAYASFVHKRGTNYQIQFGAVFGYDRCRELGRAGMLDVIAKVWLACKPLVDLGR